MPSTGELLPGLTYHSCVQYLTRSPFSSCSRHLSLWSSELASTGNFSSRNIQGEAGKYPGGSSFADPFADWGRWEPCSGMAQTSCQLKSRQEQTPEPKGWDLCACTGAGQEGATENNQMSKGSALLVSIILPIIPTSLKQGSFRASHPQHSPPHSSTLQLPSSCSRCNSQPGLLPCPSSQGLPTLQVPLVHPSCLALPPCPSCSGLS